LEEYAAHSISLSGNANIFTTPGQPDERASANPTDLHPSPNKIARRLEAQRILRAASPHARARYSIPGAESPRGLPSTSKT